MIVEQAVFLFCEGFLFPQSYWIVHLLNPLIALILCLFRSVMTVRFCPYANTSNSVLIPGSWKSNKTEIKCLDVKFAENTMQVLKKEREICHKCCDVKVLLKVKREGFRIYQNGKSCCCQILEKDENQDGYSDFVAHSSMKYCSCYKL